MRGEQLTGNGKKDAGKVLQDGGVVGRVVQVSGVEAVPLHVVDWLERVKKRCWRGCGFS